MSRFSSLAGALLACLVLVLAAAAPASALKTRVSFRCYPDVKFNRPIDWAVCPGHGQLPGATLRVVKASWRGWGSKVATANARGRLCGNMGAACRTIRGVRVRAYDRSRILSCAVYFKTTVTFRVDGHRYVLRDRAVNIHDCSPDSEGGRHGG